MRKPRRYTIFIPQDLEEDLEEVWKEKYGKEPRSTMIRELLRIGLDSVKDEKDRKER